MTSGISSMYELLDRDGFETALFTTAVAEHIARASILPEYPAAKAATNLNSDTTTDIEASSFSWVAPRLRADSHHCKVGTRQIQVSASKFFTVTMKIGPCGRLAQLLLLSRHKMVTVDRRQTLRGIKKADSILAAPWLDLMADDFDENHRQIKTRLSNQSPREMNQNCDSISRALFQNFQPSGLQALTGIFEFMNDKLSGADSWLPPINSDIFARSIHLISPSAMGQNFSISVKTSTDGERERTSEMFYWSEVSQQLLAYCRMSHSSEIE